MKKLLKKPMFYIITSVVIVAIVGVSIVYAVASGDNQGNAAADKNVVSDMASANEEKPTTSDELPETDMSQEAPPQIPEEEVMSGVAEEVIGTSPDEPADNIPSTDYSLTGSVTAHISSESVRALKAGMTPREIIKTLGRSSSVGLIKGYYEYVVDDEYLLMLRYENPDEAYPLSGEQLLETLIPLKPELHDSEQDYVYAWVAEKKFGLLVTCPGNKIFDCASVGIRDAKISFSDGREATIDDIQLSQGILIKLDDMIFETDPLKATALEIIIP